MIRILIAVIGIGWATVSQALVVDVQEFSIFRNGSLWFGDSFTDGNQPPNAPNLISGTPTSYGVLGTIPDTAEANGRVRLDSAGGELTANAIGQGRRNVRATLLTNTSNAAADLGAGLKSDDTLSISAIFGLTIPTGPLFSAYGLQVGDFGTASQPVQQLAQVSVNWDVDNKIARINYILQDFAADNISSLGSFALAPPPGTEAIYLNISRPSTLSDHFTGSFAYVATGLIGTITQFGGTAQLFQGEEFVRARFFAAQEVLAVPEPESYALMIVGLGVIAYARRRRNKA